MMTRGELKLREERNPLCRRICVRAMCALAAPLLVGSGETQHTNMDALVDAQGRPFLPGTAIAGALRAYAWTLDPEGTEILFGRARGQRSNEKGERAYQDQSRLFVYDAPLANARMQRRHGVRLDSCKTAAERAKFDLQTVERGATCELCFTLALREKDLAQGAEETTERLCGLLGNLLAALRTGEITVGARGRRGFGKFKVTRIERKLFDLTGPDGWLQWLDWNWSFTPAEEWTVKAAHARCRCLRVPMRVAQTLLIREYAVDAKEGVDYGCLQASANRKNDAFVPVIPGSSWIGALRGRIAAILCQLGAARDWETAQKCLEGVFGAWASKQEGGRLRASAVTAEESVVHACARLPMTRAATDRFTGGVVAGALFSESVCVGGTTELVLRWPCESEGIASDVICGLLLWAISDLLTGLLAVGGETAVGRGVFKGDVDAIRLDAKVLATEERQKCMTQALQWCKKMAGEATG